MKGEGLLRRMKDEAGAAPPVLEIVKVSVSYTTETGSLDAVRNVSLSIRQGESYGLVGESGSGKTTLARAIVRYLPGNGLIRGGAILLNGSDLLGLPVAEMQHVWGAKIGMVPQNPSTSVNPAIVIGEQIAEVARTHLGISRRDANGRALEMLRQVGLPDPASVARRYAHQLSGGMLQRVLIAMALTARPQLLLLDEPTTALDVTTEAVILDLLEDLMGCYASAVLYITHNLGVVARICDRVGVMYAGELVEEGPIRDVYKQPFHPYTRGLLGCVPRIDASKRDISLSTIPGFIPRLDQLPSGCIFAARCPMAQPRCSERPEIAEVSPGRLSACWRWAEVLSAPQDDSANRGNGLNRLARGPAPATLVEALSAPQDDSANRGSGLDRLAQGPASATLLEASGIKKYFWLGRASQVKAVDDISLQVDVGLTLGVVGESGCGKTTLMRCIVGLEEPTAGEIRLDGQILPASVTQRPRSTLRKLQMVFQNPDGSLNPQHTVMQIVGRPLELLGGVASGEVPGRVRELLHAVHLPEHYGDRLPHQLSGGEKQRVAIARAFAAEPELMVCDEPISSLDVSVQASLLNLLAELQFSKRTAYLFISHDLAAVRYISDFIAVVYLGRVWEVGAADKVFAPPCHPYTEALLSALPAMADPDLLWPDGELRHPRRIRLMGNVPSAVDIPTGCRFHTRCPRKLGDICETQEPPWQVVSDDHRICCHIPAATLSALGTAPMGGQAGPSAPNPSAGRSA